jgi:RNase P subunit RPR2
MTPLKGLEGYHYIILSGMGSITCKICQVVKPLTDFYHFTKDDKLYHHTQCKVCEKEMRVEDKKAYVEANKEKIAAKKKEYAQNNKEKIKEYCTEYRHRPEVKERSKVKVVCSVCGTEIRKDGLKRHMTIHDPKNYDKNGLRIY